MTRTLAIIGYGTLFQTGDNSSPTVWTSLAEVRQLVLPSLSRDVIDAGHECAPDEWREVLTGINTASEVTLECNFIKTTYQTLLAELDTTVIKARRIVLPGGTFMQFNAFLVSIEQPAAFGDLLVTTIKLRASGQPTLTVV